jgi:hypothetical protein
MDPSLPTLPDLQTREGERAIKYRDFTHPMREDVKKKHFSTPLREIPEW